MANFSFVTSNYEMNNILRMADALVKLFAVSPTVAAGYTGIILGELVEFILKMEGLFSIAPGDKYNVWPRLQMLSEKTNLSKWNRRTWMSMMTLNRQSAEARHMRLGEQMTTESAIHCMRALHWAFVDTIAQFDVIAAHSVEFDPMEYVYARKPFRKSSFWRLKNTSIPRELLYEVTLAEEMAAVSEPGFFVAMSRIADHIAKPASKIMSSDKAYLRWRSVVCDQKHNYDAGQEVSVILKGLYYILLQIVKASGEDISSIGRYVNCIGALHQA